MRTVAQIFSWIALAGTLAPALAYLTGSLTLEAVKVWMLVSTLVWFGTVPFWMDRADKGE